jgi:hypothetical protein
MIHYALFAGCTTGRRLEAALGEDLCSCIRWQEANPFVANNPKDYFPPDPVHIRAVLSKHKPNVVLSFTKAGEAVIRTLLDEGTVFIPCPHPACRRFKLTLIALHGVREAIEALRTPNGQNIASPTLAGSA